MDMMSIRRGLMSQMASGNPIYTKYELTEDTTIYQLLARINYRVRYNNVMIRIRANGTVAPQSGSYTMNNYVLLFKNCNLYYGRHLYTNGRVVPSNADIITTNEPETKFLIQDGILVYTNPSTTSCLGTTGDNVVIMEIPFDFDKYLGVI